MRIKPRLEGMSGTTVCRCLEPRDTRTSSAQLPTLRCSSKIYNVHVQMHANQVSFHFTFTSYWMIYHWHFHHIFSWFWWNIMSEQRSQPYDLIILIFSWYFGFLILEFAFLRVGTNSWAKIFVVARLNLAWPAILCRIPRFRPNGFSFCPIGFFISSDWSFPRNQN